MATVHPCILYRRDGVIDPHYRMEKATVPQGRTGWRACQTFIRQHMGSATPGTLQAGQRRIAHVKGLAKASSGPARHASGFVLIDDQRIYGPPSPRPGQPQHPVADHQGRPNLKTTSVANQPLLIPLQIT